VARHVAAAEHAQHATVALQTALDAATHHVSSLQAQHRHHLDEHQRVVAVAEISADHVATLQQQHAAEVKGYVTRQQQLEADVVAAQRATRDAEGRVATLQGDVQKAREDRTKADTTAAAVRTERDELKKKCAALEKQLASVQAAHDKAVAAAAVAAAKKPASPVVVAPAATAAVTAAVAQ
jgi:chromosome segregation ATPase